MQTQKQEQPKLLGQAPTPPTMRRKKRESETRFYARRKTIKIQKKYKNIKNEENLFDYFRMYSHQYAAGTGTERTIYYRMAMGHEQEHQLGQPVAP